MYGSIMVRKCTFAAPGVCKSMISNRRKLLLVRIINALTFALLFSTVGIVGHASAMSSGMHHGVSEHGSSSANCATICLSAPNDNRRETPGNDERQKEPEPPHYLQFESANTGWYAEKSITPRTIDSEEKIPILLRCCVLRV